MEHLDFKTVITNLKVPETHRTQKFLSNKETDFSPPTVSGPLADLGYSNLA